ncbi:MAG TPA: DUF2142 domain-containing protein [Solirubrobacteraceae bacterium]|nr:DUF2142 domain-containing protein [Solirubrobacteraceae bacterium]
MFAGERRVWRVAGICALPLLAVIAGYWLHPVQYFTGTDDVEALTYVVPTPAGQKVCVPGLQLPAGTARIRLQLISATTERPVLHMALALAGHTVHSSLPPQAVESDRISTAIFTIPKEPAQPAYAPASLCLTAGELVNWGGTPLAAIPSQPPTLQGHPFPARIALWYMPPAGARSSYLERVSAILDRAALFRPGIVGPWLYWLILFGVLPALAIAAIRCLAIAVGRHGPRGTRRLAAWVFAIAAVNFACWALITPAFQAPDEVDHFAYTQSLVERGEAPSRNPGAPLARWSAQENTVLEDMSFFTDHQVGDSTVPWAPAQEARYLRQVAATHPPANDGGGNETAATHGPIYYAALAPAYMLAGSSPLSQLTLMRLASAAIGALAALFTFLLVRELAPGRAWLAVLAALLVAYEPMYGFISGAVNNDVGVNAAAAAVTYLLLRMVRRGVTLPWGLVTGALLILLPLIKETGYSLYPIAGIALAMTLWRHHRRRADLLGYAGLALGGLVIHELAVHLAGTFHPVETTLAAGKVTAGASVSLAREHPLGFLAYLWEIFLPRLPFMAPHIVGAGYPAYTIFVKRGWGAFGWYDVFYPEWVYRVLVAAMLLVAVLGLGAIVRQWAFVRRHLFEAILLLLTPLAVWAAFEAAFYTTGVRPFIAEFGRYEFPAIAALAAIVVAALQALGRRWALRVGVGLLVAMIALSYAGQLVTLTTFYA